jgi:hypothetical protein
MKKESMKKSIILLTAGIFAILAGCVKQDFDTPPVVIPHVNFTSNMTIAQLLAWYSSVKPQSTTDTVQITSDTIIQGIVVGNDESGNIYKTLYIQDGTAGLCVSIDQSSLFSTFQVGQRVFIKCKGLYLGTYGGMVELGYGVYNGTSIGRMPAAMISNHIYRDSLPGKVPAGDTLDFTQSMSGYICKLVVVKDVTFPDFGQPFVIAGQSATNRNIADALSNPIMIGGSNFIIRTSSYANFANSLLPAGRGDLKGILTVFSGQYQMAVRDMNDLIKFDTAGIGPVLTTIYQNNFDASPTDWVVYSVKSNKDWAWDGTYQEMTANGYGGDVGSDDWLISPAINLTGVSDPILTFKTWTKYTDSGNPNPLQVFISTNYSGSGDPSLATWGALQCTLPAANSGSWTSSGDVSLAAFHQKVYIAFEYKSSGVTSSTASKWEVDTFKVTGEK